METIYDKERKLDGFLSSSGFIFSKEINKNNECKKSQEQYRHYERIKINGIEHIQPFDVKIRTKYEFNQPGIIVYLEEDRNVLFINNELDIDEQYLRNDCESFKKSI